MTATPPPHAIARVALLAGYRGLVIFPLAVGVAALAFAHTAARHEWEVAAFAPLGSNFYASRTAQVALERGLKENPQSTGLALENAARALLRSQPLSGNALFAVGRSSAARGQHAAAARAAGAAHRLSRRNAAVEAWLADDAVQRNDPVDVLDHYDSLLRTVPSARWPLLAHLAAALGEASVRAAVLPYARTRNPWFADLMMVAGKSAADIGPVATLLLDTPTIPDSLALRTAYAILLQRLVKAENIDMLVAVYRRLPGSRMGDLSSPAFTAETASNYAPFRWMLASDTDRQAIIAPDPQSQSLVIDAAAAAMTSSVVATRVFVVPPGPHRFSWNIVARRSGGTTTAEWRLTCDGTAPALSSNNIVDSRTPEFIDVPVACRLLRIDLVIYGGQGAAPGHVLVGAIALRVADGGGLRPEPRIL